MGIMTPRTPGLSKSRYVAGLQCHKLLYHRARLPETVPEPAAFDQFRMDQGTAAGELATEEFPGGVRVPAFPIEESIARTQQALEKGTEHIFEAAFNHENIHVKVDVLRNNGGSFDIIEVKSSTRAKPQYIDDLAIQRFVLEANGLEIAKAQLMHLNKNYRHPDGELFVLSDETEKVLEKLEGVPNNLEEMRQMLAQDEPPEVPIGPHCTSPYECPLMEQCWSHVPEMSVFNVPNLRNGKWEYYNQGIVNLEDLPEDFIGTPSQMPFVQSFRTGEPVIHRPGLEGFMAELEEPLYFMDFETLQLAVPKFPGQKPWQQLPVQWSVHVQRDGELEHHEFIHTEGSDPRERFITSLLDVLGEEGSIIVYSAPFEGGRLKETAEALPQYKERIDNVISRLWDQLVVFRKYYCDSRFKGSNSIKNVLPVLVPELSYNDLEVQEGGTAMVRYAEMVSMPDPEQKREMEQDLLEYCKLDTLAMVEIHRALEKIID